jgi:hypothetical protein
MNNSIYKNRRNNLKNSAPGINNTELSGNEFFKLFLLFLYIELFMLVFYSFIKQTFQFPKVELNYSDV